MKKVLFLTYFFPPSGKASLHLPLDVITHIFNEDIEPLVLTVANETFTTHDESLLKRIPKNLKVFKSDTFEPFNLYKKFIGKKQNEKISDSETISRTNNSLTHKISIWVRMNLFIPDSRVGWYFSAVNKAKQIFNTEKFDAVVSFGPPHSVHLIAKKIHNLYSIPFIPIFIDPWTDIVYYKDFKRNFLTVKIDNYLERSVVESAGHIIFVTQSMKEDYTSKYPLCKKKSSVLYWGYNESAFDGIVKSRSTTECKLLVHSGNIFDFQNPAELWKLLKYKNDNNEKIRIVFTGTVGAQIKKSLEQEGLLGSVKFMGLMSYKEMLQLITDADYLLAAASEPRHVPGKLFEYLRTGNPVLIYNDNNYEVQQIINNSNAGMAVDYKDNGSAFFDNIDKFNTDLNIVEQYDRKYFAKSLAEIIKTL